MSENKKETLHLLKQIFVFGGIFGFVYEEIFYYFDLGYLVKRGITYGPWIPIYAFGAIFIALLCKKYAKNTFLIFLMGAIISGIIEFATGYFLYHFMNIRLWDYNVEILNYGNIGGYICLRSILFFGLSAVLLWKIAIPLLNKINNLKYKKINQIITNIAFILFILDMSISCLF